MQFIIKGKDYELTKEDVERQMQHRAPQRIIRGRWSGAVRVNDTYFAWSGPTTNGSAAYFRVQGPTLVIEYAPQNSVDHIHTIYRDPTNDYGAKFARR